MRKINRQFGTHLAAKLFSKFQASMFLITCCFIGQNAFGQTLPKPVDKLVTKPNLSEESAPVAEVVKVYVKSRATKSKETIIAYYRSLIKGDYLKAAEKAHPQLIKKMRDEIDDELDNTSKESRQKTLKILKIRSISDYRLMSDADFFNVFAQSPYGRSLKRLSDPDLGLEADVIEVECSRTPPFICKQHVELIMRKKADRKYRFILWAEEIGQKYKIGRSISDFEQKAFDKEIEERNNKKNKK